MLLCLLLLALGVAATGLFTYSKVRRNLEQGRRPIQNLIPAPPKGPLNIVILGSDRRDVIEGAQRNQPQYRGGEGQRADTIILVHLSRHAQRAALISFPRDLRVTIPGHGTDKINAAYALGGPDLVIKTIGRLTGLPINHFVEVNLASFQRIVDAVGGVRINFDQPVSDRRSGLEIPKAGCHLLGGEQALSFVRARYIYPTADLGRIQAQQRFFRALLSKGTSLGLLLNPPRLIRLSDAVGKGLRYDERVDLGLIRGVAGRIAAFDQTDIDFRIYPGDPAYVRGISYVLPHQQEAQRLFRALTADRPLPPVGATSESLPAPTEVTIRLVVPPEDRQAGSRKAAQLREERFRVKLTRDEAPAPRATRILHAPGDELAAHLVRSRFPAALIDLDPDAHPGTITVTLAGLQARKIPAPASPNAPRAPTATPPACW